MSRFVLTLVTIFFGFHPWAFGESWLKRVVRAEASPAFMGEHRELSKSICFWQIKLGQVPSECYRLVKNSGDGGRSVARLDALCEKATDVSSWRSDKAVTQAAYLSPKCLARARKLSQIGAYRERSGGGELGGNLVWPEN